MARRFNPRARVGRDEARAMRKQMLDGVSIHAPVWGATADQALGGSHTTEFQSTRPCGARHLPSRYGVVRHEFQSTRPCGARRPSPR